MTTTSTSKKWSDENIATLQSFVNGESPVSASVVQTAATAMNISERSVASKLRQLGQTVESMATVKAPKFSTEQGAALVAFLNNNVGTMTYKQIAEDFENGAFSAKEIQGKVLALELTNAVKASEKVEVAHKYNATEEATFISMANSGSFIEEIAAALGKTVASVRGKALSLTRSESIKSIPAQKESHAVVTVDAIEALGDISGLTLADLVTKTGKTERGLKTILTRRGLNAADYKGADKRAKADSKVAATV